MLPRLSSAVVFDFSHNVQKRARGHFGHFPLSSARRLFLSLDWTASLLERGTSAKYLDSQFGPLGVPGQYVLAV